MSPSSYKFLADALVIFHFAFVGFVLMGGLIVLWKRRAMFLHLPAIAWGIYVEFSGRICPLTPLENQWRRDAGEAAYEGGFVDHYIMPVLYPRGLTRQMQAMIACAIILINAVAYGAIVVRAIRARGARRAAGSPAMPVGPATVPADPANTPADSPDLAEDLKEGVPLSR